MRTVGSAVAAAGAVRPRGGCRQLRLDARRGSPGGLRRQQSAQLWARPARPSVRAQRRRFSPHRHEPQTSRGCLDRPRREPSEPLVGGHAVGQGQGLAGPSATQTVGSAVSATGAIPRGPRVCRSRRLQSRGLGGPLSATRSGEARDARRGTQGFRSEHPMPSLRRLLRRGERLKRLRSRVGVCGCGVWAFN